MYFGNGKRTRGEFRGGELDVGRGHNVEARVFCAEVVEVGRSAESPELEEDEGALGMHCIGDLQSAVYQPSGFHAKRQSTHLFPSSNLFVGVYPRNVVVSAGLCGDKGSLSYQQRARNTGPLGVVLDSQIAMYMIFVGAKSRERGQGDAVAEGDIADSDRLEKLRGRESHDAMVVGRVRVKLDG